jgi:hypothetical protein
VRENGILEMHLKPFFGGNTRLAAIRRVDVQKYVTHRSGDISPASITKELNVLKHLAIAGLRVIFRSCSR